MRCVRFKVCGRWPGVRAAGLEKACLDFLMVRVSIACFDSSDALLIT